MTEQKQRRKPRKYTDEFKQQLVELYRSGKRRCDICREYDIATSLFDKWVKPVSYTHLDVYKRQSQFCIVISQITVIDIIHISI